MVPSPREHGVGEGLGVDEARRIRVICQGAGFGNSSHTAAQQTRQGDDLELTDVQEEAVLPGQIRALAQGGARTRASGYTRAPADLSVGGGLRNRSHGDPQRITGSRFGDAPGDGGSRAPRRGVQFADIESPRGRPKKKMGIVGGSINYDIILSDKEKSALKARTLSDQVQSALTEMRCVPCTGGVQSVGTGSKGVSHGECHADAAVTDMRAVICELPTTSSCEDWAWSLTIRWKAKLKRGRSQSLNRGSWRQVCACLQRVGNAVCFLASGFDGLLCRWPRSCVVN